ncbi:MAG: M28 family peptidase, partial [Planctomycetes bacterium]|nr:M28 family peptidase [Planctomycetota bacterium]
MSSVGRISAGTLVLVVSFIASGSAQAVQSPAETFASDVKALASQGHRLAGYGSDIELVNGQSGSRDASRYVEKRLRAMGITKVFVQEFPVTQNVSTECKLYVDGRPLADGAIYQARPNILQAAITPEEGISGLTVYAGKGLATDYGNESPKDKIVVLDFDCGVNWLNAFAFGARAVIFVEGDKPASQAYHHVNVPANFPRFFVKADVAEKLQLKKRPRRITIKAAAEWKELRGRNVVAVIHGTSPRFEAESPPQAVLLAAPLDSLAEVPLLASGARDAGNCAALLLIADQFAKNPPPRDVILCFFDGQTMNHLGARAFYAAIFRHGSNGTLEERLDMQMQEHGFFKAVHDLIARDREHLFQKPETSEKERLLDEAKAHFTADSAEGLAKAEDLKSALESLRKELLRLKAPTGRLDTAMAALTRKIEPLVQLRQQVQVLSDDLRNYRAYFEASLRMLRSEARTGSTKTLERLRPLRIEKALWLRKVPRLIRKKEQLEELQKKDPTESRAKEIAKLAQKIAETSAIDKIEAEKLTGPIEQLMVENRAWNTIQRILHDKDDNPDYDKLFAYMD